MPVIGIPVAELNRCARREIPRDRLLRVLGEIGCDVDGYETLGRVRCARCGSIYELVGKEEAPPRCDRCDADLREAAALDQLPAVEVVRMELLAVRPDLFDPGGLGRALRGILEIETGPVDYAPRTLLPELVVRVDPSVRRPQSLRPYIACAAIRGVTLGEDRLKIVMKMQENLHWALGRNRKHASIGVYDLDRLGLEGGAGAGGGARPAAGPSAPEAARIEYTTEDPGRCAFVPLGAAGLGPEHRRTLRRILEEHPKGAAYAHLLQGFDRYPILRTTAGVVLSMPPIINSEDTKVHPGSRNLFIDVTGSGRRIVQRTLNILATSILELDPEARLQGVRLLTPDGEETTPDLTPQEAWLDPAAAGRLLGWPLDAQGARTLLARMRHGAGREEGGRLQVLVPAYRNDILHERDLVEDLAIAHGYGNVPHTLVPSQTVAREQEVERRSNRAREMLAGLGFVEIMSLVLTAPAQSDLLLGQPPHPATVLLENPISVEQTQLRTSLLPGILLAFARNRSNPLPQAVFEVGDVTFVEEEAETGARDRRQLAWGLISPKASFADARALAEAVVREFGQPLRLRPAHLPFLLEGRGAWILFPDAASGGEAGAGAAPGDAGGPAGSIWGLVGEVHPEVLERLGLQNPAVVCELVLPEEGERPVYRSAI